MYIFYDFETSSRHLIGQIISYAFVLTDDQFNPIDKLTGKIKLNRTQCPEVDALLVNKIQVSELQDAGLNEFETATLIFNFLNKIVSQYGTCYLVGFNSNQFDIGFLRNILIKYGINPYFEGKLKNLDILHFAQYLGFYHQDNFPWIQSQSDKNAYYSFRLEDLTTALGLLTEAQSHDALEDVMLTVKLVQYFEQTFHVKFSDFEPVVIPDLSLSQESSTLLKVRSRHFVDINDSPEKFVYTYYLTLNSNKKSLLFVNLNHLQNLLASQESLSENDKLSCIRYINSNKAFFIAEQASYDEFPDASSLQTIVDDDSFFNSLKSQPTRYFDLIEKDWDIEYQIHKMGFERIPTLHALVQQFMNDPSQYNSMIQDLLSKRSDPKDNYLIQLFNRVYLNYHPNPNPDYLRRYLLPRYVDGTMYKESGYEHFFEKQYAYLIETLEHCDNETDLAILKSMLEYYEAFGESILHFQQS